MKVLRGFYKGSEIISPDVKDVRPTVDHFKKHVLRIFGERKNEIVWDLFAGSGGVGIELLSNGARSVLFVEQLSKSIACLKLNLSQAELKNKKAFGEQHATVLQNPVEGFLKNPKDFEIDLAPDFVFLDPPYGEGWMTKVTPLLLTCSVCTSETIFLAEHVTDDPLPAGINIVTQEVYGPKVLTCFKK